MYTYIYRVFPTLGMGGVPTSQKFALSPLPSPPKVNSTQQKKKHHFQLQSSSCTIFVLISYSFETQIIPILILINVQYSENAVFNFEKFLNHQNHSSSGSYHLVKKSPQQYSLLFDTKSGKLLKFQVKKNSNLGSDLLKPRQ